MKINTKEDIIQFEEKYGFIEKAEKITGLIKDIKAKKFYKNIFHILKDFNEYRTQSFNISVFTKDNNNNISDNINKINYHKEKGIKIKY